MITAAAGILWRRGEYLAVRRPKGKDMAGYWEFPGGKIDNAETPLEALRRELKEELGVTARTATFWRAITHAYPHGRVTLHVFHVTAFSGEPRPLEGQDIRWVEPREATTMRFLPADLPLVRELADGRR